MQKRTDLVAKHLNSVSRQLDSLFSDIDSEEEKYKNPLVLRVGTTRVFVKSTSQTVFRFHKFRVDGALVTNASMRGLKSEDNFFDIPAVLNLDARTIHPSVAPSTPIFEQAILRTKQDFERLTEKDFEEIAEYFKGPQTLQKLKSIAIQLEKVFTIAEA